MKVRISDISAAGLDIADTISVQNLNARMAEGRNNQIVFDSDPSVILKVTRNLSGAQAQGTIQATYHQPCAACQESIQRECRAEVDYLFQARPFEPKRRSKHASSEQPPSEGEQFDDDVGLVYFSGDHIELEPLLQESLILMLEPYWKPPCDQGGNCSQCHQNTGSHCCKEAVGPNPQTGSDSQKFSELLKKAGIKSK